MDIKIGNGALKDICVFAKTFINQANLSEQSMVVTLDASNDNEGLLTVEGYNDFSSFKVYVKAEVAEEGKADVEAELFVRVAIKLPAGIISIKSDSSKMVVSTSKYKASLNLVETPMAYNKPEYPNDMVNATAILTAVEKVVWAADKKGKGLSTVPLDCVYIRENEGGADIVASDRNVLPVVSIPDVDLPFDSVLVSLKAYPSIQKFIGMEDTQIGMSGSTLVIANGNKEMFCRGLVSEYINYERLLSRTGPLENLITINKAEILDVLKRVGILFSGKTFGIHLAYQNDIFSIYSEGEGADIREELQVLLDSDGQFDVEVDNAYLTSAINAIEGEEVIIEYIGGQKPIIVRDDLDYFQCLIALIV